MTGLRLHSKAQNSTKERKDLEPANKTKKVFLKTIQKTVILLKMKTKNSTNKIKFIKTGMTKRIALLLRKKRAKKGLKKMKK